EQESPCNNMPLYEKCRREGVNIMQMIIDECHKRGIKAYLHHRFSEVDRNSSPEAKKHGLATRNGRNEIKYNHKDWVIKTWWQEGLWNLASKELQRFKLDYIKKTMSQYSFDGICIDYLRHLPCLPVGKQWEYRDCATEFMSTLRQELNELGRSIALGAKLPENGRACHEDGFDVVRYSYDDWGRVSIVREMTDLKPKRAEHLPPRKALFGLNIPLSLGIHRVFLRFAGTFILKN
ncbi:MAG: hypothetical protein IKV53_04575, partial [Clostridia bacterium]|nr:hypothetical protein [Clostridia bacterium]